MKKDGRITLRISDEFNEKIESLRKAALPYNLTMSEVIRAAVANEVTRLKGAQAS